MSRYEFAIHTFGCKVNVYDAGLLEARLMRAGGALSRLGQPAKESAGLPRVHVFNTCAVTAEATREAVRAVRRVKAREPFATVVVTGCAAQVDGATLDSLPGADLIVANSHKGNLESIIDGHFAGTLQSRVFRSNIFRKEDVEPGGGVEAGRTRAFLKIQDGCNSFCSYCVIPFARGKSRSIPIKDLVRRARELVDGGAREIVLTGVHIGDYEDAGRPQGANRKSEGRLENLVEAMLEGTRAPRLRLTSLEPIELSEALFSLYRSSDRLCPHFHMSIQAAQSRVLSAMRRNYGAAQVECSLRAIAERVPGAFVGMDIIAGFPGETDDEFEEGVQRIGALPWTRIHAFPYSERPGTKAEKLLGSVPRATRAARSQRLREMSLSRYSEAARAQRGLRKATLMLSKSNSEAALNGLTRDYWPVRIACGEALVSGEEIEVEVTGYLQNETTRMEGVLLGKIATTAEEEIKRNA